MNWAPHEDGHRCTRHGETFARGEVCQACVIEPGPAPTGVEDSAVDREKQLLEAELREDGKILKRLAVSLGDGTPIEQALATKYWDLHFKAIRLWNDIRQPRIDAERDERLVEHDREMAGLGAAH